MCNFLYKKCLEEIAVRVFSIYEKLLYYQRLELKSAVTQMYIKVSMWFAYNSITIVVDALISSLYHKKSLISKS